MNWSKPLLTKKDLQDMQPKSAYEVHLEEWNRRSTDNQRKMKRASDASKDFSDGRNGWKEKRFTSNPDWTWGAFNALTEYVSGTEWDYFVTITSKHHLTRRSGRRAVERWCEMWRESIHSFDTQADRKFVVFWVLEEHKRGGYHVHALVRFPPVFKERVPQSAIWDGLRRTAQSAVGGKKWRNAKGTLGFWHRVDVQLVDSSTGKKTGGDYLTKYLTKGLNDWDFYCILNRNEKWNWPGTRRGHE